jgi:hypothetical protein
MKAVFYAWQSELPNNTNRSFLEDCLERSIKKVNERRPPGDQLFLDQGTENVSGMPDISRVIFDKIDTCAVFVPDLSITQRTPSRCSPNANVLIELGYALRAFGDRRILGVFNEAFGQSEELPFDLRRHRWPERYRLSEDAPTETRQRVREELIKTLTEGIAAAASRADIDERGDELAPREILSPFEVHSKFKSGEVIAHASASVPGLEAGGQVVWRNAPQATIELRPKPEKATEGFVELRKRAVNERFGLRAFGPRGAQWSGQNNYGFVAGDIVSTPLQPQALCVTQLYKHSGMLYGVNQALMAQADNRGFVLADRVRTEFEDTLTHYLDFFRINQDFGTQFSLYVTFQYVRDLFLRFGTGEAARFEGPLVDNFIYHGVDTLSFDVDVRASLRPLFEKLWDNAGIVLED